jgi:hypothetical protein
VVLGELARERLVDRVLKKIDLGARVEGGYREIAGQGYLILSTYSVARGSDSLTAASEVVSTLRERPSASELKRALAILDQRAAARRADPSELASAYAAQVAAGRKAAQDLKALEAAARGATPELLANTAESEIPQDGQFTIEETGGDR